MKNFRDKIHERNRHLFGLKCSNWWQLIYSFLFIFYLLHYCDYIIVIIVVCWTSDGGGVYWFEMGFRIHFCFGNQHIRTEDSGGSNNRQIQKRDESEPNWMRSKCAPNSTVNHVTYGWTFILPNLFC